MKSGYNPIPKTSNTETGIDSAQTIYGALADRNLLRRPNSDVFGNLVKQGEIGLSVDNGNPVFLAPGRHILWSPVHHFLGTVPITNKKIKLENVEIVIIDQSELGLSVSNGKNILLKPGQHILQSPQNFVGAKRVDSDYVQLGTHHRISVPIGYVAVAYNEGKKVIITPVPITVDDEHKDFILCTHGKMFEIESPTFLFDKQKGFRSIQMEDIQLDELIVNTSEMIGLSVVGSVRYQIVDPIKAFLMTDDLLEDIKKQAYATLTSVFSQLSIDEIATSLASTTVSSMKGKGKDKDIPHDMLHHATDIFMREFQAIVDGWGVDAKLVNITSMKLVNDAFRESVQSRAQQSMQTNTRLAVVSAQTDVELQEAERQKKKTILQAEANAESIKRLADAEVYSAQKHAEAAHLLAAEPLAAQLALMDGQAKIAKQFSDKNTIITDMRLGDYGMLGVQGQMLWLKPPVATVGAEQTAEAQQTNVLKLASSNNS